LQVRSTPGKGSVFTLYIPLNASTAPALSHPVAKDSEAIEAVEDILEIADDRAGLGDDPFVLIVEDDPAFASILLDAAHEAGLKGIISLTGSGTAALARKLQPTAITLDLGLSDIDGLVLLDLLRHDPDTGDIPVHVISGGVRTDDALSLGARDLIAKPAARDRLLQLFREIAASGKRDSKSAKPAEASVAVRPKNTLEGRKLLIVDDDIRNIYSLTSVLEAQGAEVLHAESGAEGIAILEADRDINIALVDIMMPEMDGYETIRRIRSSDEIASIPLIAVTAKAMKGDRQKCLDAGANDYISKPVDVDILLSLLRVWIARSALDDDAASSSMVTA
jgi:CheY-like chemotaxis protein